ncbi:MAG: PQQ-binding-like beta-propeller repeat protein, partial [Peptococcaceae bacterium]|nr:PQQ-binding-like beta-propeller repeat protein [Peptococcaceae bacterium]
MVDPKKVTSLYISNPKNADLEALKYFVNLKYLRIDDFFTEKEYDTYDLSPLRDLPLVILNIAALDPEKPISLKSLEPIGNIESLAILDLNHCQVTSIKDLAELTGLSRLSITDGKDIRIEDLSSLSNLTKLGEITDEVIDSKEWKFGPYITEDEPLLGLMISNGNSEEEIAELNEAILNNKNGVGQDSTNDSTKQEKSDFYYFKQYSSHKSDQKYGALITVTLEAFDKMGKPVWNYSWENLRPTELDVASEAVAYDGKVYIAVTGTLYCLDGKSGKKLWENSNDVGGGTVIYPYRRQIYLTSYYGNVLTCLDKDNGAKIWAIDDKDLYWGYTIFGNNDEIIAGYGDMAEGCFISAHYQDGRILDQWRNGVVKDESIRWDWAWASSVLDGNKAKYGAEKILDKDPQTAWSEGAEGYGINEWIQIERDGSTDLSEIIISNGIQQS